MSVTLPSVAVEGLGFTGPLSYQEAITVFRNWPGVYVVATSKSGTCIDVGSSGDDIGNRLAAHDRKACWNVSRFNENLAFFGHIENDGFLRALKENTLRRKLSPRCGVR